MKNLKEKSKSVMLSEKGVHPGLLCLGQDKKNKGLFICQ